MFTLCLTGLIMENMERMNLQLQLDRNKASSTTADQTPAPMPPPCSHQISQGMYQPLPAQNSQPMWMPSQSAIPRY